MLRFRWNPKLKCYCARGTRIRATRIDKPGYVYGGDPVTIGMIGLGIGGLGIGGLGYSIYSGQKTREQQEQQFEQQQRAYERATEPSIAAQEELLPIQKEMLEAYAPLYKEKIARERRYMPYEEELYMAGLPLQKEQMAFAKELFPYQKELALSALPRYTEAAEKLYGAIGERRELPEEDWAKLWRTARERSREAYRYGLTELGERAAGARTLEGGPIQQLATQMGIGQMGIETELGTQEALKRYYEEQGLDREYIENLFKYMGFTPQTPAVGIGAPQAVGAPAISIPGVSAAMPTSLAPVTTDPYAMGYMMKSIAGMIPQQQQIGVPAGMAWPGGGTTTGQVINYGGQNIPITTNPNY